jgi:OmpR family response regulator RpaB
MHDDATRTSGVAQTAGLTEVIPGEFSLLLAWLSQADQCGGNVPKRGLSIQQIDRKTEAARQEAAAIGLRSDRSRTHRLRDLTMPLSPVFTGSCLSNDGPATNPLLTRILIIDDQESIRRVIGARLRLRGYRVSLTGNGQDAMRCLNHAAHDLVLLDIMLPNRDGFEILAKIRQQTDIPVLILTACCGIEDRIIALQQGADDYLIKPFSLAELEARIRCLLRRAAIGRHGEPDLRGSIQMGTLMIDDLEINLPKRHLQRGGRTVVLTAMEVTILEVLIAGHGQPVSRDQMLQRVWECSPADGQGLRLIDGHISKLRRKLELNPDRPRLILTVRGTGYMFRRLTCVASGDHPGD